jgi:hypothetical protein
LSSLGDELGPDVGGLGVPVWMASSDGLLDALVAGTRIPVAGSLKESPTNANAATETATARAMPANPSPTIVSVRFMRLSLAAPVLTPG